MSKASDDVQDARGKASLLNQRGDICRLDMLSFSICRKSAG